MDTGNLKYSKSILLISLGIGWLLLGIMNFIVLLLNVMQLTVGGGLLLYQIIFASIASSTIGVYYLTLSSRVYIRIFLEGLKIHKGLLLGSYIIKFEEINHINPLQNKIIIKPRDEYGKRKIIILTKFLSTKDNEILMKTFAQKHIKIQGSAGKLSY